MALSLQQKKTFTEKLQYLADTSASIVVVDPTHVPAHQLTVLRAEARQQKISIMLVKNTLARRVFSGTDYAALVDNFSGPCLCGFSSERPGSAAKLFIQFIQKNPKCKSKAAIFEGKLLGEAGVEWLAKMPTLEEAIARLLFALKEGTVGQLTRVLWAYSQK